MLCSTLYLTLSFSHSLSLSFFLSVHSEAKSSGPAVVADIFDPLAVQSATAAATAQVLHGTMALTLLRMAHVGRVFVHVVRARKRRKRLTRRIKRRINQMRAMTMRVTRRARRRRTKRKTKRKRPLAQVLALLLSLNRRNNQLPRYACRFLACPALCVILSSF